MRRLTGRLSLGVLGATVLAAGGLSAVLALPACNKHVFEIVPRDCDKTLVKEEELEIDVPADILIVIDNSGSMCEEQANLVENFFDEDCPIDVNNVQDEYLNPDDTMLADLSSRCGFVQLLAAYDNDWRLGVITTDVGQCDNRFGVAGSPATCTGEPEENWSRRPQRGCLQPTHALGNSDFPRVLQRGDRDVGNKFANILTNIQTFGSAFERGLDAVEIFLDPDSDRAPGCENDLDTFLRDDAKLVVIFLTDEDDCSHADGAYGLPDENAGESCDNEVEGVPEGRPADCYNKYADLAPVSRYADFLAKVKGDAKQVSVAVIAGAKGGGNSFEPAGCIPDAQTGQPNGNCWPSGGNSNATVGQGVCNPENLAAEGIDVPCCTADPGTRYFQLAQEFGGESLEDSICVDSFRDTMINIAQFIARVDQVKLPEVPDSPAAIFVQITRAGETEAETIERIPDGEDPTGKNGWQYDGDQTITFYGDTVPQPGDSIYAAARATRDDPGGFCGEGEGDAPADAGASD